MIESLNALLLAAVFFVGGHFALSGMALRRPLIERLGENLFRALYSLVAIGAFVWMLYAYGAAAYIEVWSPPAAFRWIPVVLMPFALLLAVAGLTTQSPTAVGGEKATADAIHDLAPGILRVTRHPFLWGTALWALGHLAVNGDVASIILMGAILVLSLGGMVHIDRRREASMAAAWGPIALTTSRLPFAAILAGRNSFDWHGIGLWRVALALVLYAALLHFHATLFGVSALPA